LRHGDRLAAAVAEQFIHTAPRESGEAQRMTRVRRLRSGHPKLLAAVAMMERHIEEPLAVSRIARQVCFSTRQLERLFEAHLGSSPARHYMRLRLERAHHLLSHTLLPVVDVAIACGFVSAAHFTRAFRARFGEAPTAARILFKRHRYS
jgi:transcriptional regulator GlxA family with amidase domain